MSAPSILLRNATILVPGTTESKPVAALRNHSLLVEGNKIVHIAAHIEAPSDKTQVIDCTGNVMIDRFDAVTEMFIRQYAIIQLYP